jgi:hypothetical protein
VSQSRRNRVSGGGKARSGRIVGKSEVGPKPASRRSRSATLHVKQLATSYRSVHETGRQVAQASLKFRHYPQPLRFFLTLLVSKGIKTLPVKCQTRARS